MEGRERTLESCSHGVRLSRGVYLVVGREMSLCRVLGYEQMRWINRPSSNHSLSMDSVGPIDPEPGMDDAPIVDEIGLRCRRPVPISLAKIRASETVKIGDSAKNRLGSEKSGC